MLTTSIGDVAVLRLPLRVPFRGVTSREVVLVRGPAGWGEFAPFLDYDDSACVPWLRAALEAARRPPPPAVRTVVPVNATVPAVAAARVPAILERFPGCRTAKVKVAEDGGSVDADLARLAAVREHLGASGRIRIDVNAAWDLDQARRLLPVYERAAGGLEYAEQPCASEHLAALRRSVDVPLAADESIRLGPDPRAAAEVVDVVVLKAAPLGGVRAALALAEGLGRPAVVSSALDSSVGLGSGLALAAALPDLPYACGLGTAALLDDDVTDDALLPVDGMVDVRAVEVSAEALHRLAVDPERAQWWVRRIERVAEAGR